MNEDIKLINKYAKIFAKRYINNTLNELFESPDAPLLSSVMYFEFMLRNGFPSLAVRSLEYFNEEGEFTSLIEEIKHTNCFIEDVWKIKYHTIAPAVENYLKENSKEYFLSILLEPFYTNNEFDRELYADFLNFMNQEIGEESTSVLDVYMQVTLIKSILDNALNTKRYGKFYDEYYKNSESVNGLMNAVANNEFACHFDLITWVKNHLINKDSDEYKSIPNVCPDKKREDCSSGHNGINPEKPKKKLII